MLLVGPDLQLLAGDPLTLVSGVTADSRAVEPGFLFVAVRGLNVDGHDYIPAAVAAGASAVLAQADYAGAQPDGVAFLTSPDTQRSLGHVAAELYGHPSRELKLVGITGTNGKTTVATLAHDLFTRLGYHCGLIGTVETRIAGERRAATHTTPDAVAVQSLLAEMAEAGCGYAFMEVSSHALVQHRVAGTHFAAAVFTNISHDHLDYHGDMKAYIAAKKLLFDGLGAEAFALVNIDDKRGEVMLQNCAARGLRYALRRLAEYKARILDDDLRGLHLMVGKHEVHTRLAGTFNAYNLLAVYGLGVEFGHGEEEVLAHLSALPGAEGRLQTIQVPGQSVLGIVDYAHTPDALKNVLETLQGTRRQGNKVITVFGCGGDRDAAKRPLMGRIAAELSDTVIVTDDNPRTEDPERIRAEIEAGVSPERRERVLEIARRAAAIKTAARLAAHEDVILVAGKGHETYQEIHGVRHDFDDRVHLRDALAARP